MISDWLNDAVVTVCVDFNSLPGFLAVEPTRALIDDLGVKVDWLPLTKGLRGYSNKVPTDDPDDPLAQYKARRWSAKERYALRELKWDRERLELSVGQANRVFDPTVASAGLLWARKFNVDSLTCVRYVQEVFDMAYRKNLSIEDRNAIVKMLESCGIPGDGFTDYCATSALTELESLQTLLIDAGIFESPAYLYKGERFHGRAHLPLIRWYLSGEKGPPPV